MCQCSHKSSQTTFLLNLFNLVPISRKFTVYTYTESLPLVFIVSCTLALDCFVLLPPTSFLPNIRFLPRNTEKTGYHWQLISCNNSYWKSESARVFTNQYLYYTPSMIMITTTCTRPKRPIVPIDCGLTGVHKIVSLMFS